MLPYRWRPEDSFLTNLTIQLVDTFMMFLNMITTMMIMIGLSMSLKMTNETPAPLQGAVFVSSIWFYVALTVAKNAMVRRVREWWRGPDEKEEAEDRQGEGSQASESSGPSRDDEGS